MKPSVLEASSRYTRHSKWVRVIAVAPILMALAVGPVHSTPTFAEPIPLPPTYCDSCDTGLAQATFTLDNVTVTVSTPFLPASTFDTTEPGNMSQIAVANSYQPYKEFSITEIPFGTAAGTEEALGVAQSGGADAYRSGLLNLRINQGGQSQTGPTITMFGQQVVGQTSQVYLNLDSTELKPTLIAEWVSEAGSRLWVARISKELASGEDLNSSAPFLNSLNSVVLSSSTFNNYTTLAPDNTPSNAPNQASAPSLNNLRNPGWWNGDCDTYTYHYRTGRWAYRLGAVYQGMPACGPRPYSDQAPDVQVFFFSSDREGALEWECVELSRRYLYLAYNIAPYHANGSQVVWNYRTWMGGNLQQVSNGTYYRAPVPGDVLSYGATTSTGHTSVVTASSVNSSGNGTITVIQQNATANGWGYLSVSNWRVSSSVTGWLHKP